MKQHHYEGQERRQVHESCIAHSGITTKGNINIILSGAAVALLLFVLSLVVETNSAIKVSSSQLTALQDDVSNLQVRITTIELRNARLHPEDGIRQ